MLKRVIFCFWCISLFTFFSCVKYTDSTDRKGIGDSTLSVISPSGVKSDRVSDAFNQPLDSTADKIISDILDIGDGNLTESAITTKLKAKPDKVDVIEVKNLIENTQLDKIVTYSFSGKTIQVYENTATGDWYLLKLHITARGNDLKYGIDIGFPKDKFVELFGFDKLKYASVDTLSIIHNEGGGAVSFTFQSNMLSEIDYAASM